MKEPNMSNTPKNGDDDFLDDNLNLSEEEDDDDFLNLADEEEPLRDETTAATPHLAKEENQLPIINPSAPTWKVMIVDDEQEIHDVTQLALMDFTFHGKPLTFISAHSGEEAKSLLKAHPDTALVFLDVVMEENDSGLQVAKYIRETLQNALIRIILRTGQPGEAPEKDVIVNYDINDYKLKVELTQRKLFVTVVAGLRGYYDLMTIEINKISLKQTLEAMPVGVCVLDAPDGTLSYVNKKGRAILGPWIDKVANAENLLEVDKFYIAGTSQIYPLDELPFVCALAGKSTHVDNIEIHQDGQKLLLEGWGTPISNEKCEVIYSLTAFQDVTKRQEAESEKFRFFQEREVKNTAELVKLNLEKDKLVHNLKNPLSIIQTTTALIRNDYENISQEQLLEMVEKIEKSSHQMFELITNLLDVKGA
jgi:CheY-like chemotaxis protein